MRTAEVDTRTGSGRIGLSVAVAAADDTHPSRSRTGCSSATSSSCYRIRILFQTESATLISFVSEWVQLHRALLAKTEPKNANPADLI